MNSPKFYVYAWLRKNNTPYYIGKGCGDRAFIHHGKLYRPPTRDRIKFLVTELDEQDAFDIEVFWIAMYGRKDLGTGILHNRTNGGDGTSGSKRTDATREKMAAWQRGRKLTESHKTHIMKIQDRALIDNIISLSQQKKSPYKIVKELGLNITPRAIYNLLAREKMRVAA